MVVEYVTWTTRPGSIPLSILERTTEMLNVIRTKPPTDDRAFHVTPMGKRMVRTVGGLEVEFDFDGGIRDVIKQAVRDAGLELDRADDLWGPTGLWDVIATGIQAASVVICDFTGRSPNVAAEYMAGAFYGKRIVTITQNPDDIPTDFRSGDRYYVYPTDMNWTATRTFQQQVTNQIVALLSLPANELEPRPLVGHSTEEVDGTVVTVTPELAVIKTDGGTHAVLSGDEIDWSRIYPDLTKRFQVGQQVHGRFVHDAQRKGTKYTLLDYAAGNPWLYVQQRLEPGQVLSNVPVVRITPGIGAFVKVHGEIDGLVRAKTPEGNPLQPGDVIDVVIGNINVQDRKITLHLRHDRRPTAAPRQPSQSATAGKESLPCIGLSAWGSVEYVSPKGFILLKLPGFKRCGMLLAKSMSPDLRADFDSNKIQTDEEVFVEVCDVDAARNRILLVETEEPVTAPNEAKAA